MANIPQGKEAFIVQFIHFFYEIHPFHIYISEGFVSLIYLLDFFWAIFHVLLCDRTVTSESGVMGNSFELDTQVQAAAATTLHVVYFISVICYVTCSMGLKVSHVVKCFIFIVVYCYNERIGQSLVQHIHYLDWYCIVYSLFTLSN